MPGKVWKSKVDHLGASIDRCRERIDEIVQEEKGNERFNKMNKLSEINNYCNVILFRKGNILVAELFSTI